MVLIGAFFSYLYGSSYANMSASNSYHVVREELYLVDYRVGSLHVGRYLRFFGYGGRVCVASRDASKDFRLLHYAESSGCGLYIQVFLFSYSYYYGRQDRFL